MVNLMQSVVGKKRVCLLLQISCLAIETAVNCTVCAFLYLQGAGLTKRFAQTIGIAVDPRRQNKSVESRQENIQRLKEYRSKLILFPIHKREKLRKGDATEEECKLAKQLSGPVMPIKNAKPVVTLGKISDGQKKFGAFQAIRQARLHARFYGARAKKAKDAADNENNQPGAEKKGKK